MIFDVPVHEHLILRVIGHDFSVQSPVDNASHGVNDILFEAFSVFDILGLSCIRQCYYCLKNYVYQ
jgi:hypothetical protein